MTGVLHRDAIIVIYYRVCFDVSFDGTKYFVPFNNDNAASGDIFDASDTKYKMYKKMWQNDNVVLVSNNFLVPTWIEKKKSFNR